MKLLLLLLLAALPGCATIWMGDDQNVLVETNPPGAACTVDRGGTRIGSVPATPGVVRMTRSAKELWVTCSKAGYSTVDWRSQPAFNGVTLGNLALGGALGVTIDAVSGSNFNYADAIQLELPPLSRPAIMVVDAAQPHRQLHRGVQAARAVKVAAAASAQSDE